MRAAIGALLCAFTAAGCGSGGEAGPSPCAASAEAAGEGEWRLDPAACSLGFASAQAGTPFEGRFETFGARIVFDPADLDNAVVEVTIDMASVATGDAQRDRALPAGDWFDARNHPQGRFYSDEIRAEGEGYVAAGELTMRGVTNPAEMPFTVEIAGDRAKAAGELVVDRTEWGVGRGEEFATEKWVPFDVRIFFEIEATR